MRHDDREDRLRRWLGRHSTPLDAFFAWAWNGWSEGGWLQAHAHSLFYSRGLNRLRMPMIGHYHLDDDGKFTPQGSERRTRRGLRGH